MAIPDPLYEKPLRRRSLHEELRVAADRIDLTGAGSIRESIQALNKAIVDAEQALSHGSAKGAEAVDELIAARTRLIALSERNFLLERPWTLADGNWMGNFERRAFVAP